jgi:hypothetical protein
LADAFLTWLLEFGRSALSVAKRDRPENAVYLAFAVIFVASVRVIPPQALWPTYLFLLATLGAAVWRNDRAEKARVRMAELKLAAQIAKLDSVKQKARAGMRKTLK